MITWIGFRQRFSPKHLIAVVACLVAALIFARKFEGMSGFELAVFQLVMCALGCVMYALPLISNAFHVPVEKYKSFLSIIRVKPVHFQRFLSAFMFLGRSLILAAAESLLLVTVFSSVLDLDSETSEIVAICIVPIIAVFHFVVEWICSSGFSKYIT